jgi:hypothetical protein
MARDRYYSLADMKWGYKQFRVDAASGDLMVLRHGVELWRPMRLFEGVKTACSLFQAAMVDIHRDQVERGHLKIYIDDQLISTEDKETHLQELRTFFGTCRLRNIKLSRPKCLFMRTSMQCFGHVVRKGQIHPPRTYMEKVWATPKPATFAEWERFKGMVTWIVDHLPNAVLLLTTISKEIVPATVRKSGKRGRASTELEWADKALRLWEDLVQVLKSPHLLLLPDLSKEFYLYVDSSTMGVGAILMQLNEDLRLQVVACWSHVWKYKWEADITNPRLIELNGLVLALEHWACWLRNGHTIHCSSDHRTLSQTIRLHPNDSVRLRQLIAKLSVFPVEIDYVPGRLFGGVDWWSREGLLLADSTL